MSSVPDTHLCSLYTEQLRDLNPDLPKVTEHLVQEKILTRSEVSRIHSTSNQFTRLCQLLASKGTEEKEAVMGAIRSFRKSRRKTQKGIHKGQHREDSHTLNGHEHIGTGGRVEGRKKGGEGGGGGGGSGKGRGRRDVERGSSSELGSEGKGGTGTGGKRLQSASQYEVAESHEGIRKGNSAHVVQMDIFVVQFYHLINQLVLTTKESSSKSAESTLPLPVRLHVDLSADQIVAYFPHHLQRIMRGSKHDQVETLSLSTLLSAFKTSLKKFESLSRENKLLSSKANLVQSLTERNAHLEDEIWSLRKHQPQAVAAIHISAEREQEIETELHLVRKELTCLKDRNKELVVINEQWALECQEKDTQIAVVNIQLKDMQSIKESMQKSYEEQVQQLQSDKSKLKRKVVEVKQKLQHASQGMAEGKVNGEQDMLYQLQEERDHVVEENIHLRAQLEEKDRQIEEKEDEIEELKDRAGNLKVQAQSKEPTLKEFTALLSENRQLRDGGDQMKKEIETMKKRIRELKEEMLVYKTQMADKEIHCKSTSQANPGQTPNTGLRAVPTKTANGHLPNHSGVLVQPLQNDDITCLQSGLSNGHAPPFFDPTPLAPERTLEQTTDVKHSDTLHSESQSMKEPKHIPSSFLPPGATPPSCSSPNQPVAEVVGGFRFPLEERRCPTCQRVFMMIGERQFQSHVAGCQNTP